MQGLLVGALSALHRASVLRWWPGGEVRQAGCDSAAVLKASKKPICAPQQCLDITVLQQGYKKASVPFFANTEFG